MSLLNALPSGTRLQRGKYIIQKALAQGAFGITYLAKTKVSARGSLGSVDMEVSVAIKEFFMSSCNGRSGTSVTCSSSDGLHENYMKKFRNEAEHLSYFQHPNIVKVLELWEENNTWYYAMEYIDGGSLDDYIVRKGPLSEDEALSLAKCIADALSYLHTHKALHLDLKPKNVMLRTDGTPILIDFGLTKQYQRDGAPETSTSIGLGTPGYAPIEQANYHEGKQFAPTIDIYALGATLYKMLMAKTPPEATDIFSDGFPEAALRADNVSPATIALIRKAMEPRKGDRFQTVDEMVRSIGRTSPPPRQERKIPVDVEEERTIVDNPERVPEAPKTHKEEGGTAGVTKSKKGLWLKICSSVFFAAISMQVLSEWCDYVCGLGGYSKIESLVSAFLVFIGLWLFSASVILFLIMTLHMQWGKICIISYIGFLCFALFAYSTKSYLSMGLSTVGYCSLTMATIALWQKYKRPITSSSSPTTSGTINGHAYVDLGLSVKWATCNVGSSSPSDYGDHFAWGETSPKSTYTEVNSKTYGKDLHGDIAGNPYLDAARANWGHSWRLPTNAQMQELVDMCTWKWTKKNGKKGYKVTGSNGNSIFLPAAGVRTGASLNHVGEFGYYWVSDEDRADSAIFLYSDSSGYGPGFSDRFHGFSVRPVIQ